MSGCYIVEAMWKLLFNKFNKPFFFTKQGYYTGIGLSAVFCLLILVNLSSISSKISLPSSPTLVNNFVAPQNTLISLIPSWHLFGSEQVTTVTAAQLNLTITGVFYSTDNKRSAAIISGQSQSEKVYHPGDSLPGGVILQQVTPQGILLLDNGQVETLLLPKPKLSP